MSGAWRLTDAAEQVCPCQRAGGGGEGAGWLPAASAAKDLAVEDVRGRCRGSRAESGGPGGPSERRIEKWLMLGSNSGRTSPSVMLDHRAARGAPSRLADAPVAGLDADDAADQAEDARVAGRGDASAQAGRTCPAAVGIKGRAK
jgi:hypothetical protein